MAPKDTDQKIRDQFVRAPRQETDDMDKMNQQIRTVSVAALNNQLGLVVDQELSEAPPTPLDPLAVYELIQTKDKYTGQGCIICPDCGAEYWGHFVEGKFEKGTGHCFSIFPNGAVYWGHLVEGKFDGEGILMYPANDWDDRVMYHGHWKGGQKEGRGKLKWKDGGEYVGDFKHDECHGQGKFTYPSNDQSEFNNVHWNNLQDIFDQQLDLPLIISYVEEELKTSLKKWLGNEIPPNGDTWEGRWKCGNREGVHVKTSSEGQILAIEKCSNDKIVCNCIWDWDYSSSEDEHEVCSDSKIVYEGVEQDYSSSSENERGVHSETDRFLVEWNWNSLNLKYEYETDTDGSMHSVDEITTSLQLMKSPSRQETDEVVMEECVPSNDVGDSCHRTKLICLTKWCKTVLEKHLLDTATAYFSTISSDATYIAMVKKVKDMTGNASVALAGGKTRCEFVLMLSFI